MDFLVDFFILKWWYFIFCIFSCLIFCFLIKIEPRVVKQSKKAKILSCTLSHKNLILQSQIFFSSQSCFALHNKSFLSLHKSTTCCTTFLSWHFLTHSSFVTMNFWKNITNHGFKKNNFNLLEKSVPNFWILNDDLPNSWSLNDGLHLKVNYIWY